MLFATGCGTIRTHYALAQPELRVLTTCPGGEVLSVGKTRDLPNAFGHADVWGGKVDAGYEKIVYLGTLSNGDLLFRAMFVDTISTENTVNRYLGGEVVSGVLGPRMILPGSTHRVSGPQQDIIVNRKRMEFQWRRWELVLGRVKGTPCLKYHISPVRKTR